MWRPAPAVIGLYTELTPDAADGWIGARSGSRAMPFWALHPVSRFKICALRVA
jgi:hypothetical protein